VFKVVAAVDDAGVYESGLPTLRHVRRILAHYGTFFPAPIQGGAPPDRNGRTGDLRRAAFLETTLTDRSRRTWTPSILEHQTGAKPLAQEEKLAL
jgi:hypothetical protein